MPEVKELKLGRAPDAVPRARRMARDAVACVRPELAADAELVVAELVTNAALHGEPPIIVRVLTEGIVRVEVEDAGRSAPVILQRNTDVMTGRGLSMVAAVASRWGVVPGRGPGKVVWAELDGARPQQDEAATDIEALLEYWSDDDDNDASIYTVRLGPIAVELLAAAKAHIDNVVRELALLHNGQESTGVPLPAPMAELVRSVNVEFAEARAQIKRQAAAAAMQGHVITELELHLPASAAEAGERYLAALDKADRFARNAHLLTLAPPPAHRIFRRWYVESVVKQLRAAVAGEAPPTVRPLQVVMADEVARLYVRAEVSERLAMLHKVTSELAAATVPDEMARIVVDNAVEYLGVETARVRLLTEDGMLRSAAWRARGHTPDHDRFPQVPISSDLPAAIVARTGQRRFLRSVSQLYSDFPETTGIFAEDTSGHVVPLTVGDQVLGVLLLSFIGGELTDEAQAAFVEALADALAQALKRAELAGRDTEQREALSFLAEATQIMTKAHEPNEVLEGLVSLAVPRLGDWCTVYLAEGNVLRRVAMAIDGFPGLAQRLQALPLSLDVDVPHTRAFFSGHTQPIEDGIEPLLEGLYPGLDFPGLGGDARATGVCVPLLLRERRVGVIGLTFLRSGRRITPQVIQTLAGLGDRAVIALDNAEQWRAQRRVVQSLVAALLSQDPPSVPGVEFVTRYVPAAGDVSGDWWEAVPMPDGTVLIGMGGAAWDGLDAVAQMSELRWAARALAAVEPSPSALLADLVRRQRSPDAPSVGAVYGRLDPTSGRLWWANAGHVPPLYAGANGHVAVLDYAEVPGLGTAALALGQDQLLVLAAGDTVVLYSDSVVDRPGTSRRDGIDRLVRTVTDYAGRPLDELADAIFALCDSPVDGCCILLVRCFATSPRAS